MKKIVSNASLVILKPDILGDEELVICLKKELNKRALKITECGSLLLDIDLVKGLYGWKKVDYPKEIEEYLCQQRLPVWLVEGPGAVEKTLLIKKELRTKHCTGLLHTLIHSSDSKEDFEREWEFIYSKMKTNNQIEVIVFIKSESGCKYLILKRNSKKGDFWQPITGNVEFGESFEDATRRELMEETGITKVKRSFDLEYTFSFHDDNRTQTERVFCVEVLEGTTINLSSEHTAYKWVSKDEALSTLIYPGNKKAFEMLGKKVSEEQEIVRVFENELMNIPQISDYIEHSSILGISYSFEKVIDYMVYIEDDMFKFEFCHLYDKNFLIDKHLEGMDVFVRFKSMKWLENDLVKRPVIGLWILEHSVLLNSHGNILSGITKNARIKFDNTLIPRLKQKYLELRAERHNLRFLVQDKGNISNELLVKATFVKLVWELLLLSNGYFFPFRAVLSSFGKDRIHNGDKIDKLCSSFLSVSGKEVIDLSQILIEEVIDSMHERNKFPREFLEKWWLNLD